MAKDDENQDEPGESELPDEADVKDGESQSGTYPCPYCGQEVYEDAVRCPHCQRYVSKEDAESHSWRWLIVLLLLAAGALVVWALMK